MRSANLLVGDEDSATCLIFPERQLHYQLKDQYIEFVPLNVCVVSDCLLIIKK